MPGWLRLRPAPEADELGGRTVHEVVRDYPEALVALQGAGVDTAADGGRPLGGLRDADRVVEAVLAATAWRRRPGA